MPVPPTVTRWFASRYPSLQLAPQWLEECHAFLTQNFDLTAPVLLKKVENQLLLSDLATSTVHHAGLFPANEEQTDVFFEDVKGQGVLVQVLEILEIGRPAHELLKLHRDKVEDRKVFKEQGRAVRRAVTDVGPTQDGPANDTQDADASDESGCKAFPRAMLRLRVSDGFNEYVAIETKRIRELSMDDTPLGCKLMLKSVRCLRGILMLDDACCIVKGGSMPELDKDRDAILEALLVARIEGTDVQVQQREPSNVRRRTAVPVTAPAQAGRPSQNGTMRPEPARASSNTKSNTKRTETSRDRLQAARQGAQDDDFDMMSDDDEFDEEALAILQAAEAAELSARDQKAGSDNKQKTKPQGPSRGLAAAAKPLAAGAVSTSRSGGTQASSNGSAFKAKGAAQVIDLDDSEEDEDDDEEVALMLLSSEGPQEVAHGHSADRQATRIDRPRRNQPIEID